MPCVFTAYKAPAPTPDVCRRLNVKCWATDLHRGFDIQKGELPLGFDMWIYHPPYWDIIPDSGNMWGQQPDPHDGSHIPDYSKFLEWANENLYRMDEALPQGGLIVTLTADVRKKGILYPLPMDLTRFGETVATVIKVQYNTQSERKQYANANFVAIQHEILVISRKPNWPTWWVRREKASTSGWAPTRSRDSSAASEIS